MEKKDRLQNSLDLLARHLKNMTDEEKAEMEKFFEDKRPKGWLSIEEHLPMMFAEDLAQGYTVFKVRDKDGREFESCVTDHTVWYYMIAKPLEITHWLNE